MKRCKQTALSSGRKECEEGYRMKKLCPCIVSLCAGLLVWSSPHTAIGSGDINTGGKAVKKHIATLFYGAQQGQIGLKSVPEKERLGPQSFAVDGEGNMYLCDTVNNKVQVISPQGKLVTQISAKGYITDLAVDDTGNIVVLEESKKKLLLYGKGGALKNEIPIPSSLIPEKDGLKIQKGMVCLLSRNQTEYEVGRMVKEELRTGLSKTEPVRGMTGAGGALYRVRMESKDRGEVVIVSKDRNATRTMRLNLPRLVSIVFLGEDVKENIYLQVEQTRPEGKGINLRVLKMDPEGNVTASIDNIPNNYASWTACLLRVNDKGEIYQMLPTEDAVELNMWKLQ